MGLNAQIASFQSNKLTELTQMAEMKLEKHGKNRIPDGPAFSMKLSAPMTGPKIQCRKIAVQGAQAGKYFEFPDVVKSTEGGAE